MTTIVTYSSGDLITYQWANLLKTYLDSVKSPTIETKAGSDCSGSNGETNRILTLKNTPNTLALVGVGGQILTVTNDYTISGDEITFLGKIFNEVKILVLYFELL